MNPLAFGIFATMLGTHTSKQAGTLATKHKDESNIEHRWNIVSKWVPKSIFRAFWGVVGRVSRGLGSAWESQARFLHQKLVRPPIICLLAAPFWLPKIDKRTTKRCMQMVYLYKFSDRFWIDVLRI